MKILILGQSGSGKSTLLRTLSHTQDLTALELDRVWLQVGGSYQNSPTEKAHVQACIHQHVSNFLDQHDSWVIDGSYRGAQTLTFAQADMVIFLHIPLWRRVYNHLSRVLRQSHRHPELTILEDLKHTWKMIRGNKSAIAMEQRVLPLISTKKIVRLFSYKEVNDF